jgi:hypothetical protein
MSCTRRQVLARSGSVAASIGASFAAQRQPNEPYQLFWGDLHNHNAVGYAQGSLERTYDIARSHLDFVAFTPHSQWHDMPQMPNNGHLKWVRGFEVLKDSWDQVSKLAAAHNQAGKFVSLLAYEWHSSFFGDYCLYYPNDGGPLLYHDHVRELQKHARAHSAIIIPHHLAYKQGWRGANIDFLDPSVSPVMEIFSEHGLSEHDRGGRDYVTHSNGGRYTKNTYRAIMRKGFRAGVIASTDDHLGYPGAYGEGLAGLYAKELTREGLFDALRNRRSIAATGDRIQLTFKLNGQWMGSSMKFTRDRSMDVSVVGGDEIERVEIVKNDRTLHRFFPEDHTKPNAPFPNEVLCRIEFGWGPWAALSMNRTVDWEMQCRIKNGKLLDVSPCFQSGPFDEKRRNKLIEKTEDSCRVQSYTSRTDAYAERATNSVVLRIAGEPGSSIELEVTKPAKMSYRKTFRELVESSDVAFTGAFQEESVLVHRLVTPDLFRARFQVKDRGTGGTDYYYARVIQTNGHQAWSSPIWIDGA